jgi:hypothetical protein
VAAGSADPGDRLLDEPLPIAREQDLVITDLQDEVLVYDLSRHRAHCLNRTAARVWRHADGQKTVAEIAGLVRAELDAPMDEAIVRLALRQLGRAHLLEEPTDAWAQGPRETRRDLLRNAARVGLLAAAVPAVLSLVSPTPAAASSVCGSGCSNAGQCPNPACPNCTGTAPNKTCT